LFVMMQYFIDHANWKDTDVFFPNVGEIALKRGQHLCSTRSLSVKLGVDRQRIRTKLKKLEKVNFLTRKTTNKYTIVSIINYDVYQSDEELPNQQTNPHLTHTKPTPNPHLTTDKKDKHIKKEKNKESEGFALPSEEILKEASVLKINSEIESMVAKLYDERIFPKVHAFKNKMLKVGRNERAILHTLTRCYLARNRLNGNAWAYCTKIMQVENGNYNESDYNKTS